MRHASLFTGIGGFDLAAQWMGWDNVFQVEIDSFCQKVLEKNFPNVKRYGDIKDFDGTKYRGAIDVLSGGFPCQPFSVAGKRKGKNDDRYLWPEMLRVIKQVRPSFIVGENVTGIIGMALEQVLTEVEVEGYYTETFIIPACAVNAPHRRDRIWIIAYTVEFGRWQKEETGLAMDRQLLLPEQREESTIRREAHFSPPWLQVADAFCGVVHGLPRRVDRTRPIGNAIVPQVAYEIFKAIETISTP